MTAALARDVASRMNLAPVLHDPGAIETLAANIRSLAGAVHAEQTTAWNARKAELVAAYDLAPTAQRKPFAFSQGKAIVPVHGTLINRFSASWGFVTGYNFIRSQVDAAAADPDVNAIILDVNSFGGMAAGCMETADIIFAARQAKPIVAVIDAYAYSAGYALASAASRVVITPSGGAGSIGVVTMHISMERALQGAGVEVTFIHAGAKKVHGNPYENLSKSAKADIQHQVDDLYGQFVSQVSRNRGLDAAAVRKTEAATFTAADAKAHGLVDMVASPGSAIAISEPDAPETTPSAAAARTQVATAPELPAIRAQIDAAVAEAVTQEKARQSAILDHPEAAGRRSLAVHLAGQTNLPLSAAVEIMTMTGREEAPVALVGEGAFAKAMQAGLSSDRAAQAEAENATVARVLRTVRYLAEPGALVADEESAT